MRREIVVLATAAMFSYLAEALYSPFYAVYVEKIGGGVLDAGLAWGIYMIVLGTLTLVIAQYMDRLRRHAWILYTGFFIASVLSFAYLFIRNVEELFIVQFLMGVTWAAVNPVWDAYYSLFIEKRSAVTDWSLFEGGSRIANGLGAILGGIIIALAGFKGIFIIAGLLNLAAAVLLFIHRKELSFIF